MNWNTYINGFTSFITLEKSLSPNSIEAYLRDIRKLKSFLEEQNILIPPTEVQPEHLHDFSRYLGENKMSERSQSRVISGIKAFFQYLLLEDLIDVSPAELIEGPKIGRKLPPTLSVNEIKKMIRAIDLSKNEGIRNKTIIHLLYGCGLRVSELISLKISDINFSGQFLKILGKGNKERLVPLGSATIEPIKNYLEEIRNQQDAKTEHKDILFLNRRGGKLSRQMIFYITKDLVEKANINKVISPHSFRHSFASHLVEGGADLRIVQQILGHESITTTEIYTHLSQEHLEESILKYHPLSRD
ncbi:MAG: site-specific tyrosine recombinase XerD [Bacteroidales bacterium]